MRYARRLLLLLPAMALLVLGSVSSTHPAAAVTPLLPNLQPLPASEVQIATDTSGHKQLRFSTTAWNKGDGPFELIGGAVIPSGQIVYQRVYNSDGSFQDYFAGVMVWHPTHNHFHFNNYARYVLRRIDAVGANELIGEKVTSCVLDSSSIDLSLPGAPPQRGYSTCSSTKQGMSVGWGDTYPQYLDGQSIDITGQPDGEYGLTIQIDPRRRVHETNNLDNWSTIRIRITGSTVTVLTTGEVCDGLDNNNDGRIDELFPNADGDSMSDCIDPDDDNDGYLDTDEWPLGKSPTAFCAIMRADVDGDHSVSIVDLGNVAQHYLEPVTPANERYNQDGDNAITILDLARMATSFLLPITACPDTLTAPPFWLGP